MARFLCQQRGSMYGSGRPKQMATDGDMPSLGLRSRRQTKAADDRRKQAAPNCSLIGQTLFELSSGTLARKLSAESADQLDVLP
jgi:hypothetical protein